MAFHGGLLEPYIKPGGGMIVTLTAFVLFLDGPATAYRDHLRAINQATMELSAVETVALAALPFLIEPVLLLSRAVRRGIASRCHATSLLSGLAVAAVLGTYVGQSVGAALWTLRSGFAATIGTGCIVEPRILLVYNDVVELLVRDFLTVVAALGVASAAGAVGG